MTRLDRLVCGISYGSAILSASIVVLVLGFLIQESYPALAGVPAHRFVTDPGWYPKSDQYSMLPMIVATLVTSLGALVVATPLGLATAVYLRFYARGKLARFFQAMVELLGGVPSVVFGLWGMATLTPLIARLGGSGQNLLTATLILALMILPTIALTSFAAIVAVPHSQLQAAAALGLRRPAIIWRIVLPWASPGILTGMVLGLCRALGETMAVVMLAGNVVKIPDSLLSPGRTLTANIALELGYTSRDHRSLLFVSGLLVLVVVTILVLLPNLWQRVRYAES